jgi:hypothetical protein
MNGSTSALAGQGPREVLITNVPEHPDSTIRWHAPTPASADSAVTAQFEGDDGTPFTFTWVFATLSIEGVPSAVLDIHSVNVGESGRGFVALRPQGGWSVILVPDAERLIARYDHIYRLLAAGVAFRQRGRPKKVTRETAPEYAAAIRRAYRACVKECGDPTPSQLHMIDFHSEAIGGYTSLRGFESLLLSLRQLGFHWPDAFR